ncbi:response regulator transcription factor [Hymenobacter sp. ASUV-10]|uniref:Response regulator transcription factor n=1 Tax=Hymenobacter aranciens TaxID=3063996 RepID=A0ABT9B7L5_9BACT|nr:response regulator transcription factor [Hymenobacter sp. ASUV-10]MDO7874266.1 response regulator transcription factor [Hymenobacter sp. ASUV-10]
MDLIRVAIADDQVLFRKGMAAIVDSFEGIQTVIEVDNGLELIEALGAAEEKPHVALLDLSMPEMNGVETTKVIRKYFPDLKVVILSVYAEDRFVIHLMELGVNAYLFKNVEPAEVEKAIRTVVTNEFYFNNSFREAMNNRMQVKRPRRLATEDLWSDLSARERDVLELICKQRTGQEIADELGVSVRTVDGHRSSILEKTGARNTAGLVLFAIKHGLLDPSQTL